MNEQAYSTEQHRNDYNEFKDAMAERFVRLVKSDTPLFEATSTGFFDVLLSSLPADIRQHYTCDTCRHFFDKYAGLALVGEDGDVVSAMFGLYMVPTSNVFRRCAALFELMISSVSTGGISEMFTSKEYMLGTSEAGGWSHFSVALPPDWKWLSAGEHKTSAEAKHDFENVRRFLGATEVVHLREAVRLVESGQLPGAEKVLGPAGWALALKEKVVEASKPRRQHNFIWQAVASAPAGFCHPAGSLLGVLVEMLKSSAGFPEIYAKMASMTHGLSYQRPQALPSEGNRERAEKLIAELGLESALKRRFARLDEVEAYWRPTALASDAGGGVFAGVPTKQSAVVERASVGVQLPAQAMTWVKFRATVLGSATEVQFFTGDAPIAYGALLTATDVTAEPILRWDSHGKRNPVSGYVYSGGSFPLLWGLSHNSWVSVLAVTDHPAHWFGNSVPSMAARAFFVLEGARESRSPSLSLFPEMLKSALREVRSTIEAYSKLNTTTGNEYEGQLACGYFYSSTLRDTYYMLRARTGNGTWTEYKIDRWD
jgi:hypothetical protein